MTATSNINGDPVKPGENNVWHSPEGAGRIMSLGAETVRLLLRKGKLAGKKLNSRCWRISQAAINQFMAQ